MVVTRTWIRDHYDTINKDRLIEHAELTLAHNDFSDGIITQEQVIAVSDAYNAQWLLPAYDIPSTQSIQFNISSGATLKVDGVEVI